MDNTSTIEHMVEEYALDMALVEGTVNSSDLVVRDMMEDELVMLPAADILWRRRKTLRYRIWKSIRLYPEGGSSAEISWNSISWSRE